MIPDLTHLCVSALFSEWLPSSNRGNALPCPHPDGETDRGREGGRGKERAGIRSSSLQADWASLGHMPTPRLVIVAEGRPWVLDCVPEPISGKENGLTIVHLDPICRVYHCLPLEMGLGSISQVLLKLHGGEVDQVSLRKKSGRGGGVV